MFETVRHWWGSGHGKVTARLFLFEFVVVVAGVLVAQALSNEVQRRNQVAQMELSDRLAQSEMATNYGSALIWQRAGPCISDRLAEIMRFASVGPVPSSLTTRPRIVQMAQTPFSSADQLMLRDVKGQERADFIGGFAGNVEDLSREARGLTDGWGRIELVDGRFGTVSLEDRVAARAAAADIRARLRVIDIVGGDIVRNGQNARLNPDFGPKGNGPAKNCDAIWRSGRINPPLTMR